MVFEGGLDGSSGLSLLLSLGLEGVLQSFASITLCLFLSQQDSDTHACTCSCFELGTDIFCSPYESLDLLLSTRCVRSAPWSTGHTHPRIARKVGHRFVNSDDVKRLATSTKAKLSPKLAMLVSEHKPIQALLGHSQGEAALPI